jgi:REP element-mobilizing transposase RayT
MGQTLHAIYSHIIFSTKNREPWLRADLRPRLYAYIGGIIKHRDSVLLASGGIEDHVHLLIDVHPALSSSDLVRDVKANSSRWIHESAADLKAFAWQSGYAVFSVSRSVVPDVRTYIENQEEHHRTITFKDELIAFLERHGVSYDARYVFD